MATLMRSLDWGATPIGPAESWPQSLRTAASICLASRFPILIWWGPELVMLYNDAYRPMLGSTKHPTALGQRGRICWPEIWHIIGPMLEGVLATGAATWSDDQLLVLDRNGYLEECYFTFSYSPIRDESGGVGGVFTAVTETTQRVLSERRLRALRDLADRIAEAQSVPRACQLALAALGGASADIPFAALYLHDPAARRARLAGTAGVAAGSLAFPSVVDLAPPQAGPGAAWALAQVVEQGAPVLIDDLTARFGLLPGGAWPEPASAALVLPVIVAEHEPLAALLIVGLSPRRALDDDQRGFVELVANQIASAIGAARAYEAERQRAEALAELDRAKTAFFSNISHEFRTPLTLMLGPMEELLQKAAAPAPEDRTQLQLMHRNALRLLKLVNTLLDFSRIEAGRIQASYEPTDLAALTADLASVFRSAVESAGLGLIVDCPPLADPVYVDRDMWEKLVLNLLSNAFKFTFDGEILVALRRAGDQAELTVRDTGTGIPAEELPHLFERFHRVKGARGRTFEGSGIGLALVQELVRLHGGVVRVASEVDRGTTFIVSIPMGAAHLPADHIAAPRALASAGRRVQAYVEEAQRWLPEAGAAGQSSVGGDQASEIANMAVAGRHPPISGPRSRVLLADDNADMREYVRRLLNQAYDVVAVNDGASALRALQEQPFDLVLADVMMPELDGMGLLRALRADERARDLPVILLSARAGEEARVEGLEAGADDYLVKPFSATELLARIGAHLTMAGLRRKTAHVERALRAEAQTARERLEDVLAGISISETRLHLAVEAGAIGIWDIDLRSGVRTWSDQGKAIYGLAAHEHMDYDRQLALVHPDDRARVHALVTAFRDQGTLGRLDFEHRIVRPDGSLCWVAVRGEAIYEGGPLPVRLIGTVVDITRRKQADEALRASEERLQALYAQEQAARAQAEAASRLKDEFLATISHELRTPLTSILGYGQMLLTRKRDETYVRHSIEKMVRSAKAQAQLIDDLLDVSRIVTGKLRIDARAIDMSAVIQAAIEALRPAIDAKAIRLETDLYPEASSIVGDPNRLQQVVWNLLSNAVKFTPLGGAVRVCLESRDGYAQLTVSDSGQGISAEFLPYVFDRFRQAESTSNRTHGGLGLGLAIVRHLVEMHGGTVRAHSAGVGAGATFTVRLPLSGGAAATSDDTSAPYEVAGRCPPALEGIRVLVVDDQPDIVELLHEILTPCGAQVRTTTAARDALATLRSWQPDVLVSDIAMPGDDGYWLIHRVRALAPEEGGATPALALTAYVRLEDRMRVLAAGFQLYVPKPVDQAELLDAVARLARAHSAGEA